VVGLVKPVLGIIGIWSLIGSNGHFYVVRSSGFYCPYFCLGYLPSAGLVGQLKLQLLFFLPLRSFLISYKLNSGK
jgi:hypothetical protein